MNDIAANMFRHMTNSIIKKYAPQAYHNKQEWEYEYDNNKIAWLRVWLNDDRDDEPFVITPTQYEADIIDKICNGLNFVENDMD